jgi:SRSO17 transposase
MVLHSGVTGSAWMMAGSMEATLELWASSLRDVKARIRPLFTQARVAASAGLFLDGLLGPERRKTGWMRAEAAGDPGPWRQQAILGRGRWDADALRDVVREYALDTLADPDAVLVIDETGFLKQGKSSCGVGRQYTGSAGSPKRRAFAAGVTNCQIGVFAAYVSRHGHAFVDRALYLPKAWTDDPARLAAAHVPADVGFATKPRLARRMIERAMAAGVPFSWVAADSVYGVSELEMALRRAGKGYVLGVNANSQFNSWIGKPEVAGTAEEIAQELDPAAWQRLSAGEGTKGPRLYDWAYLELADLDADEYKSDEVGLWTRGLLIRRSIADGACAFFTTWCPAGTGIDTLVAVEGQRWTIEDSFECAKNEFGLDHNESRSWHGWHRHVSLVMLAFAMLATIRHHANQPAPSKTPRRPTHTRQASSTGRSRKSAASPPAWHSAASGRLTSSPGRSGAGRIKPPRNAHI